MAVSKSLHTLQALIKPGLNLKNLLLTSDGKTFYQMSLRCKCSLGTRSSSQMFVHSLSLSSLRKQKEDLLFTTHS